MRDDIKIGLFVPCYKLDKYLDKVLSQMVFDVDISVISKNYKETPETQVRNDGIKNLAHCDYIFTLDADEFILKDDQRKIIDRMESSGSDCCFISVINYTKDLKHRIKMTDHAPAVCVKPSVEFYEGRCLRYKKPLYLDGVYLHHLGFAWGEEDTQWKIDNYWDSRNPKEYEQKLREPIEEYELPYELKKIIEEEL